MTQFPRPVIMVSATADEDAEAPFKALTLGAFDYVPKQLSPKTLDIFHIRRDLIIKLSAAAQSRRRQLPVTLPRKPCQLSARARTGQIAAPPVVVALGASTGVPRALEQILPLLPRDLPVPILVVQHMPPGFTSPFAQRLNSICSVSVREALHREAIRPGVVYIAPGGKHMTVKRSPNAEVSLQISAQPSNCLHIPSIDMMMNSVAQIFGSLALGVILTGMGSDGALGMKAIYGQGGITVGQDEASCVVYGMPRACAELGVLTGVLPLARIPAQILEAIRARYAHRKLRLRSKLMLFWIC